LLDYAPITTSTKEAQKQVLPAGQERGPGKKERGPKTNGPS